MGVVVIRCPETGREFSTGILTDEHSFKVLPDVLADALCPLCGGVHSWRKPEARLVDDLPSPRGRTPAPQRMAG